MEIRILNIKVLELKKKNGMTRYTGQIHLGKRSCISDAHSTSPKLLLREMPEFHQIGSVRLNVTKGLRAELIPIKLLRHQCSKVTAKRHSYSG